MSYSGELSLPNGKSYRKLDAMLGVEFARSFGVVGEASVTISDINFKPDMIRRNWRLTLWRHIRGKAPILAGGTIWFIRKVTWKPLDRTITLHAQDALGLLKDRIVAYTPQTSYADKTIEELGVTPYAVDSMNAYLRENFGTDSLDVDRDASAYFLVPEDREFGAQVNKEGAWQDVLSVIQDLSRASAQNGVPIMYDVSMNENGIFVFNSWVGRRGKDRTLSAIDKPHVFSPERNNIADLSLVWDYTNEKNVVYVGGYDSGASRVIATVVDESRVRADPFARAEVFIDGGDADVIPILEDFGRMALEGFRPRLTVEANAVETPESVYGVHYDYADTVPVIAGGFEIPCDITAISGSYSDGKDSITLRLTGQRQL